MVSYQIMLRLPPEVIPCEDVRKVGRAVDRHKVDLRIVGELVPIHKPAAASKKRLETRLVEEDLIAFGAHACLESGVIGVAKQLLALREETAILGAKVDAASACPPLARACIEDAHAALQHRHKPHVIKCGSGTWDGRGVAEREGAPHRPWQREAHSRDHDVELVCVHIVPDIGCLDDEVLTPCMQCG